MLNIDFFGQNTVVEKCGWGTKGLPTKISFENHNYLIRICDHSL
jgi:hypothetical protein